jgi:hypothetical protein
MKLIALAALLTTAGCSKKSSECDAAIGHGMDAYTAAINADTGDPQRQQMLLGVVSKLRATLVGRCKADQWQPDAVACFSTAASQREIRACEPKLNREQRTKLTADLRKVMMSGAGPRMPSGLAGHPMNLTGSPVMPPPHGASPGSASSPAAPSAPAGAAAPAGSAAPAAPSAPAGAAAPAGSAAPAAPSAP